MYSQVVIIYLNILNYQMIRLVWYMVYKLYTIVKQRIIHTHLTLNRLGICFIVVLGLDDCYVVFGVTVLLIQL